MKYTILLFVLTSVVSSVISQKKNCELLRIKAKTVVDDYGSLTSVIPESTCGNWLYINDPKIRYIKPNAFQNFSTIGIKKLIINNGYNNLHATEKSFTYLSNLQTLKIQGVIRSADIYLFNLVPLVRELKLAVSNDNENVLKNILTQFPNLIHLTIFKCKNLIINSDIFRSVASTLRHLEFINNKILLTSQSPFTSLKQLVTLNFEHNNFDINFDNSKEQLFDGLSCLQYLSFIGHKNITQISKNIFSKLPELRELNLEGNNIRKIVNGSFWGSSLDVLNLRNNQLENIQIGAFDGLHVHHLYLQGNDKINIEENAFDNNCTIGNDGI